MIQYALKCTDGHEFDSWFQSAAAFDKLAAAGMVSCAICGNSSVEKAIMTPRVRPARSAVRSEKASGADPVAPASEQAPNTAPPTPPAPVAGAGALSQPASEVEKAIAEMRRKIEDNSDYVGADFASEARAIHDGDAPERAIYGEAKPDEARALIEDGVQVAPLPFLPNRKMN